MKTRPEMRQGFNFGAFVAAGLTAVREATFVGADIAHNVEHIKHPHPAPELYQEVHGTGRIYAKPVSIPHRILLSVLSRQVSMQVSMREWGRGR
jgi:alpha/beta superfamily hydrolase